MTVYQIVSIARGGTVIEVRVSSELYKQVSCLRTTLDAGSKAVSAIELHALFLEHCAQHDEAAAVAVLEAMCRECGVPDTDIHVVIQQHSLDEAAAQRVLRAYYLLWNAESTRHCYFSAEKPALFAPGTARPMAVFGGNSGSTAYLAEARWLLDVYRPLVGGYVSRMASFLSSFSKDTRLSSEYDKGIDLLRWLAHPSSEPGYEYLVSTPISIPLSGLVQLMHVMVLYKTLGVSPGELARSFRGKYQSAPIRKLVAATGHSQGVAMAAMFSMLTDNESFVRLSIKVLGLCMLIGATPSIVHPGYVCPSDGSAEPRPRPMVLVRGLTKARLGAMTTEFNQGQESEARHMHVAVVNTHDQIIVAGTTMSAAKFVSFVGARSVQPGEDQSKVPPSKRKPVATASFVDITGPYHCPLLEGAVDIMHGIALEKGLALDAADMQITVRGCDGGHDIRGKADLTRYIIASICVLPVDWPQAVADYGATHIVDFGTGGFGGFGRLALKNVEGRGIPVICAGALLPQSSHASLGTRADLFRRRLSDVVAAPNWLAEFGARVVRTAHDGQLRIDTRMSRTLGVATVMVVGMTPTTGNEGLVAAVHNAGYHAEIAGGTIYSEDEMVAKLSALAALVEPGQGITLNCIYLNQRQWGFQFPLLLRLRREGLPIAGLCIGGGVPLFDKALEVIGELRAAGIRHVGFKPSSASAIRDVIRIARAADGFPVVLQWTGGRGGGHHSHEDFYQPLLETYAAVRACPNVALVVGSGFGDAAGTLPYMTGEWSTRFGRAPMPFDGVLLGPRIMVAREAATSRAAKELIVTAAGLPDAGWNRTYDGEGGGITTFTSEYGEINHVPATRAVRFVQDMQSTILNQPRDKQVELLLVRKDEIVARLNADHMRSWFGRKADGRVADLEDMTYAEVVGRMVELMYVKHQRRWIHHSYHQAVMDFIDRVGRRLAHKFVEPLSSDNSVDVQPPTPTNGGSGNIRKPRGEHIIFNVSLGHVLNDTSPELLAVHVVDMYPEAETQLLMSEDVQFFIGLCKRCDQKPLPFVPVLDADFGMLLLKDSLWQSEDLDSVVGQDVQRVIIRQGHTATQCLMTVDEPVKDILDGIYRSHIRALVERLHGGDESSVPAVEYLGADPVPAALPAAVQVEMCETERVYRIPLEEDQLPGLDEWLQALAGPRKGWLHALVTTPHIVQGARYAENYARRMLRPRAGRTVAIRIADGLPTSVEIRDSVGALELEINRGPDLGICLTIYHRTVRDVVVPCTFELGYAPSQPLAPIHGDSHSDEAAANEFSVGTWAASADEPAVHTDVADSTEHLVDTLTITESHSRALCQSVGNRSWQYVHGKDGKLMAPMEFIHVSAIRSVLRVTHSPVFGGGVFRSVHLYNRLQLEDGVSGLHVGDTIVTDMVIDSIEDTASGKRFTLTTTVCCNGQKIGSMDSAFLSLSHHIDAPKTFRRSRGQRITISLPTAAEVTVLESRDWFLYREDVPARIKPGMEVEFCLDSEYRFAAEGVYSSIATTGTASIKERSGRKVYVADVDFRWGAATKNPVLEYLERRRVDSGEHLFESGGYSLTTTENAVLALATAPASNREYAKLSLDCNSIHTNPYVADFAGLPGTIAHGLWTAGSSRAVVESIAADGHTERVRMYQVEFTDMVLPSNRLRTELFHVGMRRGRMLISGRTLKDDGTPVLNISAEIDQPKTAYLFTGQGLQDIGMGMALYEQSAAARDVWDRANQHMLNTYDIDLLDIVRTNPSEVTVHFHGAAGCRVRDSYLAMVQRIPDAASPDGHVLAPVVRGITPESRSHTFRSPTGILATAQLAQVAMAVAAMAAVADMRANGLVQKDAMFAGHSLGEYCAVASLGGIFTLEAAVDTIFYRGLTLHSAVPRDEQGRSDYGMVAVDLSGVGGGFGEDALHRVVDEICAASSGLLQVINYNVHSHQYVASGTLRNLAVLRLVLDAISGSGGTADIGQAVHAVLVGPVSTEPVRGKATVPIVGVDVSSHSRKLADSVPMFRKMLRTKLSPKSVSLDALCRRYIPNLTGVPFEVSREYFELVREATGSLALGESLDEWDNALLEDPAKKLQLGTDLLVELLAYHLAAPVQWIKTQDCLFKEVKVGRVVEIGPSSVLCGMAAKTLRAPEHAHRSVALLHFERDQDEIYYRHSAEDAGDAAPEPGLSATVEAASEQPKAEPQPVQTVQVVQPAGASEPIADVPLQTLDVVHPLVAFKLKQPLGGVDTSKSIKALVGGKSTLQNEIVGDLQKEFGARVPDKPEEAPLHELGAAIGTVSALGRCTQPLAARLFSSKMPGGFSLSAARAALGAGFGLGPQRQDALLLVALTMEPAARLGSEADARGWLAEIANAYAKQAGIAYARSAAAAGSGAAQGPAVSSAELERARHEQREHARQQLQVLARYAGVDLRAGGRAAEAEKTRADGLQKSLDGLQAELGDDFVEGIRPMFDARKARRFDSYWNWARQDAFEWIQQTLAGGAVAEDEEREHQLRNCADEALVAMLDGMARVLGGDPALAAAHGLAVRLRDACKHGLGQPPVYRELAAPTQPQTTVSPTGDVRYSEVPRVGERSLEDYVGHMQQNGPGGAPPPLHLRERAEGGRWTHSPLLSGAYYRGLAELCGPGASYAGAAALVTGCGRGSIGAEVVRGLLMGGARVVATTSSYSRRTTTFFEDLFRRHGSRGAKLVVVPFNQGSAQDVEALAAFVSGPPKDGGLGWGLDYVFPFAAVPDVGSVVTSLGSRSELAQRAMLTNVMRLLGAVKAAKERTRRATRPALAVLPLSPNHGDFGGDGFYGECKIGLETAFNRWASEGWAGHLSVAGAVIGWTRGTSLMVKNTLISSRLEELGMHTFSARKMALNILALLHPGVADIAHYEPVWADFGGGMDRICDLSGAFKRAHEEIDKTSSFLRLDFKEATFVHQATYPASLHSGIALLDTSPLAKHRHHFPAAKDYASLAHLRHLQGMVNLDKVVVVTGYGEVGPYGNAETRWEVEAFGELSTEGCIELAWIMGLIRHANGPLPGTGQHYTGWVDAKSGEPVRDANVKEKYGEYIRAHTGIRLIEPDLANGYDPEKKQVLREVQIEHDMEPFVATAEDAAAYKKSNGDRVDVWENADGSSWSVRFLKGALIRVPAAVDATRLVAALLPTGWDATRFGIPEDVIRQVDPVTLYVLVATVEALARSGITDPYELYQHVHVSEVGNTIGSAMGGARSTQGAFHGRNLDQEAQNDVIQEAFVSTVQAWVNMLLLSAAGPVKPIVGACATTVLSIDTAVDAIQTGKAKVMIAGATDDFCKESSAEFGNMGATSNTVEESASGREPSEMCRPCTSTRNGFMDGHGAGVAVLMSASTAIACGAPIYGIIGMSVTATDKQGQSIPAPGKGILGTVHEAPHAASLPQLDVGYRRQALERQLRMLDAWKAAELEVLGPGAAAEVEEAYRHQRKGLQDAWGNEFWKRSPGISPLRGSLAVWGLTADDIGLASFHGTSTVASDKNESQVLNAQMRQLGRTPGHPVPVVCQKWLTGHSKGAAAGFMLNGVIQSMRTGLIPGNRNADNICAELSEHDYALYLSRTVQTPGIKAALLNSFGMGQIGGELLIVHPDYLLATLSEEILDKYNAKLQQRSTKADRYWQDVLVGNHPFVQVKNSPPYTPEQELRVLLDPTARAHYDPRTRQYRL